MEKIDWKRKLSSRKFLAAVAGIVTGLAMIFGLDENTISTVAGAVVSIASVVAYIMAEGKVDAESVKQAVDSVQGAVEAVQGPPGPQGPMGPQGMKGEDGVTMQQVEDIVRKVVRDRVYATEESVEDE